jgi:outer membrane usher protein FimD/PapC
MTSGPQDPPTTTFASNTPTLYAIFKTEGAKAGDKIRGVLIAEDVGDEAPANTKVFETILDMDGDTEAGDFTFNKPVNGWPVGKYRVEIYVNDELATTAKFTIKAAKEKSRDEEEEEPGN